MFLCRSPSPEWLSEINWELGDSQHFRAHFARKRAGLCQGCVGWIHTLVFAAVSWGGSAHQPLPNCFFTAVAFYCAWLVALERLLSVILLPGTARESLLMGVRALARPSMGALLGCQSFALLPQYLSQLFSCVFFPISACTTNCRTGAERQEAACAPQESSSRGFGGDAGQLAGSAHRLSRPQA